MWGIVDEDGGGADDDSGDGGGEGGSEDGGGEGEGGGNGVLELMMFGIPVRLQTYGTSSSCVLSKRILNAHSGLLRLLPDFKIDLMMPGCRSRLNR